MLAGIKAGKKKKRKQSRISGESSERTTTRPSSVSPSENASAATKLKKLLSSGKTGAHPPSASAKPAWESLEERGRIAKGDLKRSADHNDRIVLKGLSPGTHPRTLEREDYKHGSRRGKIKRSRIDDDQNMSVQDMLKEELSNRQSMDEVFARNVARVGSRYKGTELGGGNSKTGADEEEEINMTMYRSQQNLTQSARQQREQARQVAQYDHQQRLTARCWWWMESPSFVKLRLIALGNHVQMSMAPAHLSLDVGNHFYIVPLSHVDSLAGCDSEDIWSEVRQFQDSLRDLYAAEGKDVVFCETILQSKSAFWQTRLECFVVPKKQSADLPMYFQSSLREQADEWGTHSRKLIHIKPQARPLNRALPSGFPYFYVEYDRGVGVAQILEQSKFPPDFGADTIGGMMGLDPMRMRRKVQKQSPEQERKMVLSFLSRWKGYDWTLDLDG